MNSEQYAQALNLEGEYTDKSAKEQYKQAWHLRRYAETRRNKLSNIMSLYYFMCAEYGISYKIAHKTEINFSIATWPMPLLGYYQRKRIDYLIAKDQQINANDIIGMAYFW